MDFKSLLQSIDAISETVHKGTYGTKHGKEDVRDQYGHKIGKINKDAETKKDEPKRTRGRPTKAAKDEHGNDIKHDTSGIQSMLGSKPKGKVGKVSAKNKLKDWIEAVEANQLNEDSNERPYICVHARKGKCEVKATSSYEAAKKAAAKWGLKSTSGIDAHLTDVTHSTSTLGEDAPMNTQILSAALSKNPDQMSAAEKNQLAAFAQKTLGATASNPQATDKLNTLLKQTAQTAKMTNPTGTMGSAITQHPGQIDPKLQADVGKMKQTLNQIQPMHESDLDEVSYSAKAARAGKDIGKPGKNFSKIAKDAGKRYGSKEAGERVAGAVLNKLRHPSESVDDMPAHALDRMNEPNKKFYTNNPNAMRADRERVSTGTNTLSDKGHEREGGAYKVKPSDPNKFKVSRLRGSFEEGKKVDRMVAHVKASEKKAGHSDKEAENIAWATANKRGMLNNKNKVKEDKMNNIRALIESINFKELISNADQDVQEMLYELQTDVKAFEETGETSDLLDAFLKVHLHHSTKKIADESANYEIPAIQRKSAGEPTLTLKDIHQQDAERSMHPGMTKLEPKLFGQPEQKSTGFLQTLKSNNPFRESANMKDKQFEGWEKQLNTLLNEGITVSSSTGQQGSPDSVSVTANDEDAQKLLSALRQAGIGVFGGEDNKMTSPSAYGAPHHEEEPGNGTEIPMSPTVVGDGDDMMALIKKMSGIEGGSSEKEEPEGTLEIDYEPEEDEECETCGHSPCDCDHEEVEEGYEETDEGAGVMHFKKEQAQKAGQDHFKLGNKEYPVKENAEDCMECGMPMLECSCDTIEEGHNHEESETCNECGMYECECGTEEQVEESYANSDDDKAMQDLHYMLQTLAGGLNKPKHNQATGNIQKVTMETTLMKDSSSLLTDWQKLSGIK